MTQCKKCKSKIRRNYPFGKKSKAVYTATCNCEKEDRRGT